MALSGGGARGIAHLGVLRALEELDVKAACISGTSVGAILGALYAHGLRPGEILDIIVKTPLMRSLRPAWTLRGLLSMDSIQILLRQLITHDSFGQLSIPLTVVATDLQEGRPHYFSSGVLTPALLASSCVPGMFNPVAFNNTTYVDGGITDNLPAGVLRTQCDFVIGLHCNPVVRASNARNFRNVLERTLLLAINGNAERSKQCCDLIIEPNGLGNYSTFELSRARELEEVGYLYAMSFLTPARLAAMHNNHE